jgi:acetylornithine deacetylase
LPWLRASLIHEARRKIVIVPVVASFFRNSRGVGNLPDRLSETKEILSRLVAFESVSGRSNLDMIGYIQNYLQSHGVGSSLSYDATGERANLFATIGPAVDGGVMLNGHTDVVPVSGQDWSSDPFILTETDGRLFGRGAVDMKGFLACMLAMVPEFLTVDLKRPVHISFCYDEEIGGFGAPVLAEDILGKGMKPEAALVGEPTGMQLVTGHKAGFELRTVVEGLAAHASDPRKGVNAIAFATRYIGKILEVSDRLAARPADGSPFDPPFTTINIGIVEGGAARNITAESCTIEWEIRPLPGDDPEVILAEIEDHAGTVLLPQMLSVAPGADISTMVVADVPALDASRSSPAVELVRTLTGSNSSSVVAFGTDAGHFERIGLSTVVFGPGSIDQAHKPDEYIEIAQIEKCLTFMRRLGQHLSKH